MPKYLQSQPLEFLLAYAITFAAGAVTTLVVSAYTRYNERQALALAKQQSTCTQAE